MVMVVVVEKVMVEMVILINCFCSVMLSCHSLKWVPNIWELRQVITLRKGKDVKKCPFDRLPSTWYILQSTLNMIHITVYPQHDMYYSLPSCRRVKAMTWIGLTGSSRWAFKDLRNSRNCQKYYSVNMWFSNFELYSILKEKKLSLVLGSQVQIDLRQNQTCSRSCWVISLRFSSLQI